MELTPLELMPNATPLPTRGFWRRLGDWLFDCLEARANRYPPTPRKPSRKPAETETQAT